MKHIKFHSKELLAYQIDNFAKTVCIGTEPETHFNQELISSDEARYGDSFSNQASLQ